MVRICGVCQAKLTELGRTAGVFCDRSTCPWPRLGTAYRAAVGARVKREEG